MLSKTQIFISILKVKLFNAAQKESDFQFFTMFEKKKGFQGLMGNKDNARKNLEKNFSNRGFT